MYQQKLDLKQTTIVMSAIQSRQFDGQPLILKTTYDGAENDFAIHCAGHAVGRIKQSDLSGAVESWRWSITGPFIPPALQPRQGRESTLADAKVAFRSRFDALRTWALEKASPVQSHNKWAARKTGS